MESHKELKEDEIKIHLICDNIFLSLSIGFYLRWHLSTIDDADFIITDLPHLKDKYTHLPICTIGYDLKIPCSVFEMFSQLHDFYSRVNAKQAEVFQQDIKQISKFTALDSVKEKDNANFLESQEEGIDIVENIKREKLKKLMQNTDPALSDKIESLFNELTHKIYDALNSDPNK